MINIKCIYLIIVFILLSCESYAQMRITGQVLDDRNTPIEAAIIDVAGKNSSAITDGLGIYIITLPNEVKKGDIVALRVSKQGYRTATRQLAVSYISTTIKLIKVVNLNLQTKNKLHPNSSNQTKLRKKENTSDNPQISPEFNAPINNSPMQFGNGNIQNNKYFGRLDRHPTEDLVYAILNYLPLKSTPLTLTYQTGDVESMKFCSELKDQLEKHKYINVTLSGHIYIGTSQQLNPVMIDTVNYTISVELNGH